MKPAQLIILGSTGSIGCQTLDIVAEHPDRFSPIALTANGNWKRLAEQANRYRPDVLWIGDESTRDQLIANLEYTPREVMTGRSDLLELATLDAADLVLNSLVGFAGFAPTIAALKAGKKVALANKESLVVGGQVIRELLGEDTDRLIPVDSEHSAMLQCLTGEQISGVEKIIITASGGPFRNWSAAQMDSITVEDALAHPTWKMGSKITIDSSTMMNKGLEIIEAHWLFGLPVQKIEPVVHPQSIIHSIVEFVDGSSKAQMALPDMKIPIIYALGYPERLSLSTPRLSWSEGQTFTFEPVDYERFPCLELAIEAGKTGGHAPAVMNAANEVAVERFLKREIGYIEIARIVEESLERIPNHTQLTPQTLYDTDRETRDFAHTI